MNPLETREAWLRAAAADVAPWLADAGHPVLSPYRVAIGFPSTRALATRKRTIGECWSVETSADKTAEIFISPLLGDEVEIVATLVHELGHVALGSRVGHKAPFPKLMRALDLEGKATATFAGDAFKQRVAPILRALGPLPHAKLTPMIKIKKQTTRMLKCECETCGYTARVSKKWIDLGAPWCPVDRIALTCQGLEEGEEE